MYANEVIKPYEAMPQQAEEIQEVEKITPFTFMTSVSETKQNLLNDNEEIIKEYNSYIINRGFGYFLDTILYANELNIHNSMPKEAQYMYYLASLRKRKRYSKWHKLERNPDLDLVQKIYNCRTEIAKQYLKLLSKDNLDKLREISDVGGNSRNK